MDFIMFYEHHAREVDGLLLLKAELAKRGYASELVHYTFGRRWMYHRFISFDVAMAPFLYNDLAASLTMARRLPADKIVNLQWEQVRASKAIDITAPYGKLRLSATHLCWGEKGAEFLMGTGIPAGNARVAGALHLDLCTEPFRPYYRTKSELAKEAGLSAGKRWLLFVSNLVFANDAAPQIRQYKENRADYIEYSKRALKTILAWAAKYCGEHPEAEFIYRPHPNETVTGDVLATAGSVENFQVVCAGTAREWVLQSEVCFVHSTTTIAEIYAAGKTCGVLRPEHCPAEAEYDMPVYEGCESISDYTAFARRCDGGDGRFPVDESNFRGHYDHRRDLPAYRRVADALEEVLNRKAEGPDVISLLACSDNDSARLIVRVMDGIALFSDMFRYGEIELAGVFMRVMGLAHLFTYGFNAIFLKIWPWRSEIPEKQRKLCDIIGAPELPDVAYLERAVEAHRQGKAPSDFDSEGYGAVIDELERIVGSENPEPEALFAAIKNLLPLSQAEPDGYDNRLLSDNAREMAAVILKLLHCGDYPLWEEVHAAVDRFTAPFSKASRVIMYGAGRFAPQVRAACVKLGIVIAAVWDKRAEELKAFEDVPVALPFSEDPGDNTLVLLALSYNSDYYPVREELMQRGYNVMDGAMAIACAEWEEAKNAR